MGDGDGRPRQRRELRLKRARLAREVVAPVDRRRLRCDREARLQARRGGLPGASIGVEPVDEHGWLILSAGRRDSGDCDGEYENRQAKYRAKHGLTSAARGERWRIRFRRWRARRSWTTPDARCEGCDAPRNRRPPARRTSSGATPVVPGGRRWLRPVPAAADRPASRPFDRRAWRRTDRVRALDRRAGRGGAGTPDAAHRGRSV